MPERNEIILDREDPKPSKRWFESSWLFALSFPLLAVGILFFIQHWPASRLIIIIGAAITILRNSLVFFKQARKTHEWFYFIGTMSVVVLIISYFILGYRAPIIKLVLMTIFAVGIIAYLLKWPGDKKQEGPVVKDDAETEEEEDFADSV